MWFLSARKARRTPTARSQRGTFRPRLEALEDRCLMSAGALDTNFGSGGLVVASNGSDSYPNTVAVRPVSGKIVAATQGVIGANGYASFGLAGYNPDGSIDFTFGNNGIISTV